MKVAVYGRGTNDTVSNYIQLLFDKLHSFGAEVVIYEPFYNAIKLKVAIPVEAKTFNTHNDLGSKTGYLLSVGGDGTFLETLNFVRNSGIPVLGINTGRLGFLANVAKEEIETALDALKNKKFVLEQRTMLSVIKPDNLFGEVNYGLNELTLLKKDSSSMITIHTSINGHFLNSYFADGLIIATPTGSTAYSLSCGGPLVMPGSQNFVITPIAPHNLNVRPLVIPDNNTITLTVEGRSPNYLLSLDSRSVVIDSGTELTLKKTDFCINVIQMENQNFYTTIRNKLLWGIDRRV